MVWNWDCRLALIQGLLFVVMIDATVDQRGISLVKIGILVAILWS